MKKINYLFIVLLLTLLGACDHTPTEPNVPPESIVIVTIPFVEVTTTATKANLRISVNTNGNTSITIEYGIGNYSNNINTIPSSFSINTIINTEISNLVPNTKYKFRIKSTTTNRYLVDSTFVTNSQLQLGDTWNKGVVISLNPKLLAAPVDQSDSTKGLDYAGAIEACKNYAEGYRLPADSIELKIISIAKKSGILKNFVSSKFAPGGIYISSEEMPGNNDYIFCVSFNDGFKGWTPKSNLSYVRAVCSF